MIIVEDIIDTGRTISYLRRNLATRHPRSLALCVLLDKVARREVDVDVDYVGFVDPGRVRGGLRPRPRRPATGSCPIVAVLEPVAPLVIPLGAPPRDGLAPVWYDSRA